MAIGKPGLPNGVFFVSHRSGRGQAKREVGAGTEEEKDLEGLAGAFRSSGAIIRLPHIFLLYSVGCVSVGVF